MEALLSLAFDKISSKDSTKIKTGLRQIEGLLAQICLSSAQQSTQSPSKHRRSASVINTSAKEDSRPKTLQDLPDDPAFREFFRLQDGFEWNVASRLITTLERLLGFTQTSSADLLILSTLTLLHGTLLLHPPSRALFTREIYMNLLLDLLDSANPPAIQSTTLLVLVTALLGTPQNTRVFERIDGLLTITSAFKSRSTTRGLKGKLLEFLYFYLMPEVGLGLGSEPNTVVRAKRSRSLLSITSGVGEEEEEEDDDEAQKEIRSTDEKQKLLGKYLSNVEDLVQDLRESTPFGV
ncbi:cell division control protein 14 [Tothia fuscella]|uniref:Cell division control protein 14 n=1 Tax=Tothia fuscella TaxID=1048955 RepID=A0A9P4NVG8_9PEZI|nr:cell division control protein 14 [Tothia fuscella]